MKKILQISFLFVLALANCSCNNDEPEIEDINPVLGDEEENKAEDAENDSILSIIAIGNSYSSIIVQTYLLPMFESEFNDVRLCNMFIACCSLEQHLKNATSNSPSYDCWVGKSHEGGVKTPNVTLEQALDSYAWDYVVLQQYSALSGKYDTYGASLPGLMDYVRAHVPSASLFAWHQTWAYEPDYEHYSFGNYDYDQARMYAAIMDASASVMQDYDFDTLIPAGTAIQNMRNTDLASELSEDGTHLKSPIGQYAGACVWFEAFTGIDARTIKYKPSNVSDADAAICRWAAHAAMISPFAVTLP